MADQPFYNVDNIKTLLPHRYPFLLIDRVLEFIPGKDKNSRVGAIAKALKNVTINEDFFNGHFPDFPIMPGVLIIEAMAQAGGLACYRGETAPYNLIIASINHARFRRPVVPGDQLILTGEVLKDRGKIIVIKCSAHVDGELVAEAEVMAQVTINEKEKK
ncbi:MAG: 3-hydroxyacyl-ACP dehydratase FabZ [Bdellovibrionales bacterium]|nr:3-hydroxyacyl-ACP dehydratase FabZ [Bdellovibrionales bacterium]